MFKEIPQPNANIRPFKTHKSYVISEADYAPFTIVSSSDLTKGGYSDEFCFRPETDAKTGGLYQRILHKSLEANYYHPDNKMSPLTGAGKFAKYAYGNQRELTNEIEILLISQSEFGEEIKPGSVELFTNERKVEPGKVYKIVDDGYGNLIESNRAAKLLLLDEEKGLVNFSDFDGNEYYGTTDLVDFESGSININTIIPGPGSDPRVTAKVPVQILTADFQCGIMRFEGEDPFELISNWANFVVGNVFYADGLIVMTDSKCTSLQEGYTMKYKATHTIYEHEYFIEVGDCEFNYSQNPTAIEIDMSGSYDWHTTPLRRGLPTGSTNIKVLNHISRTPFYSGSVSQSISGSWDDYWDSGSTDLTGSYLVPMITTIGLYNNENEMLAVAKLPKPIQNLPDYPVNFIVRFDI